MIGTRVGPYRLVSLLGSGGMGSVFHALAEEDGEVSRGTHVAMKVVHTHLGGQPEHLKRFLREADLGRRVDHPNVVRTLGAGTAEVEGRHVPYLVMELVVGRTLRDLQRELRRVPEALVREIAVQAAAALEAVHALGIVHRDVKPENLFLTADQRLRLMDLGVARHLDASLVLTLDGQFAGSLLYAAPEQFQEGEVGAGADLYALGVTLHELAGGRNPFDRSTPASIVRAHLDEAPDRLDRRDSEVSPFLAEVVATLLAKSPRDRFPTAFALREALEGGERSAWWAERETRVLAVGRGLPKLPVRRETAVHGRGSEHAVLDEAWARTLTGGGGPVLIEGEAGIGKTRLVDELLHRLPSGTRVLYGSFPPEGGLSGLSEAVTGLLGSTGLESALAPRLSVTPALVPAFAAWLRNEAPPAGATPLQGDALHTVFAHLVKSLAAEGPLVWIVDDLHFARPEARRIVLSMARASEGTKTLLVLTTRPALAEAEMVELGRLAGFRRLPLGRLSPREVMNLLRDAFGSEALAERLGGRIASKSDGVPFFVFEMIRGLEEGKFLRHTSDGTVVQSRPFEELQVPSAVKDLVGARLRALTDDDRNLLDAACVEGFEFDPDLLARVAGEKRVQVLQRLAAIERSTGLVRAAGRRFRFDHHQVEEVLYGDLAPALREEYHGLLAAALREREGVKPEEAASAPGETARFLAVHDLKGGRAADALPWLDCALDHLEKGWRHDEAIVLCHLALAAGEALEPSRRYELLMRKAARLDSLGRREEERADLSGALAIAEGLGDLKLRAKAERSLAVHLWRIARHAEAKAAGERALALAKQAGDVRLEASATGLLGLVMSSVGRYQEASALHQRHLELAKASGDVLGEGAAEGNLGNVAWFLGRYEEARAHHEKTIVLARERGDRAGEARALGNLGLVFGALGQHEESRSHYERHLALAREMGHRQGECGATTSLANAFQALGHYEEALKCGERVLALAPEIGDRWLHAIGLVNLGLLRADLGDLDTARTTLEEALALARSTADRRVESYALERLAFLADREGDPTAAEKLATEALGLRRDIAYRRGIAEILTFLGRLALEAGSLDEAKARLSEALTLSDELGLPGPRARAAVLLALVPGAEPEVRAAAERIARKEEIRFTIPERMEIRWLLHRLSREPDHLRAAYWILHRMVAHAPEASRVAMVAKVPLHRAISDAAKRLNL